MLFNEKSILSSPDSSVFWSPDTEDPNPVESYFSPVKSEIEKGSLMAAIKDARTSSKSFLEFNGDMFEHFENDLSDNAEESTLDEILRENSSSLCLVNIANSFTLFSVFAFNSSFLCLLPAIQAEFRLTSLQMVAYWISFFWCQMFVATLLTPFYVPFSLGLVCLILSALCLEQTSKLFLLFASRCVQGAGTGFILRSLKKQPIILPTISASVGMVFGPMLSSFMFDSWATASCFLFFVLLLVLSIILQLPTQTNPAMNFHLLDLTPRDRRMRPFIFTITSFNYTAVVYSLPSLILKTFPETPWGHRKSPKLVMYYTVFLFLGYLISRVGHGIITDFCAELSATIRRRIILGVQALSILGIFLTSDIIYFQISQFLFGASVGLLNIPLSNTLFMLGGCVGPAAAFLFSNYANEFWLGIFLTANLSAGIVISEFIFSSEEFTIDDDVLKSTLVDENGEEQLIVNL